MVAPRIMLLHATPVAMDPVQSAFRNNWPEAETVNVLEDGLTIDRAKTPELTPQLTDRFVKLCHYANDLSATGLLITCSAFGPAIERAASELSIPVLKPNEAMFEAGIASGTRIAMVATFEPAVITMVQEFEEQAAKTGSKATLTTIVVPEAMAALRKGDADTHNKLIADRASELSQYDAVMLAHFSTSRAASLLRQAISVPVLAAPESAVIKMRRLLQSASRK
jgi:hypothetical protein